MRSPATPLLLMPYRRIAHLALTLLGLAIPIGAHAMPIASIKAMGMGRTSVAYGQDAITSFFNPATAATVETRIDAGLTVQWSRGTLELRNRPSPVFQSGSLQTASMWDAFVDLGVNFRLGHCEEWAVGLQWNNYDLINTRFRSHLTDFSGTGRDARNLNFHYRVDALTATGAYNLNENHSFGVGLNIYLSWLRASGLEHFVDNQLSVNPNNITDLGGDNANGIGVTLGWVGTFLSDTLSVALAYSPRVHMGHFDTYSGLLPTHSLDIPQTFRAGLAYQWNEATVLASDFEYRRYSHVASWNNPFAASDARFSPLLGTGSSPGFGWQDNWAWKIGVDHALYDSLNVRAGYRHERAPVRSGTTDTAFNALTLQTVQDYLSWGLTWKPTCAIELSYFSEVGFHHSVKGAFPNIADSTEWASADTSYGRTSFLLGLSYGYSY